MLLCKIIAVIFFTFAVFVVVFFPVVSAVDAGNPWYLLMYLMHVGAACAGYVIVETKG